MWGAWAAGLTILVVAGVLVYGVVHKWLRDRPFARHTDASESDVDAGGILVTRLSLTRVAVDGGAGDGAVGASDAAVDSGLSMLDGPAPGNTWASHTKNILLVGVDRKPWGRGGGLADTIILAALDMRSGHVGLVSVPRDYYVEFRPGEFGRINTAFHFAGENSMSRERYLAKVVGDLLGVRIRETFIVDLTVLERAVDAVGGVDVDVPCAIRDNFVDPRTETGRRLLDVSPGDVHMDGLTAAMYARSRHGRSDWDRARRQQAVVLALRRRATSFDALPLIPRLLDELSAHIETEMSRSEILELGRFGMRVESRNMHGMVLASSASEHFRTPEGSSVLIPNVEMIRGQIRGLFDAPPPGVDPHGVRCADVDAALGGRTARPANDAGRRDTASALARDAGAAHPASPDDDSDDDREPHEATPSDPTSESP